MMYSSTHVATHSESVEALGPVCEMLKVTPYKLAALLAIDSPRNVYRWFNEGTRPSQRYCIRMMRLMQMSVLDGVKFALVERIEWPEGKIIWKMDKQNDKNPHGVPASKRAVSKGSGSYGIPMAQFLD